jgi:beta-glucosidase
VKARYEITPLAGLQKLLGNAVTIKYAKGYSPVFSKDTTIAWGKRPVNRPDLVLMREAVKAARKSDVAIIFAGTNHDVETESTDRMDLKLPFGQDELIKEVVKANPRTIVVVIAGGPTDLQTAMETAPAVLYGWYNGSQAGRALADVLFGKINPSGKLPFTFPVNLEDSPAHALKTYPGDSLKSHYDEGILVGYRWYDTKKIQPQLCFGYGLSYTTFAYSGIATNGPIFSEDGKALVTLKLKNTGKRDGYETVQLYSSFPDSKVFRAEKELKGIAKVFVRAGKEKKIVIPVKIRDLAYYDDASKCWTVEIGKYRLFIGASSRDIQKQIDIVVE